MYMKNFSILPPVKVGLYPVYNHLMFVFPGACDHKGFPERNKNGFMPPDWPEIIQVPAVPPEVGLNGYRDHRYTRMPRNFYS